MSDSVLRPNNESIMRLLRPLLVFALLHVQPVMAVDEDTTEIKEADSSGEMLSALLRKLDKGLDLIEEQKTLSESAGWFRADKTSKQKEIDALLDEAIALLEIPEIGHYRQDIAYSEKKVARSRERIATYRRAQLTAPISPVLGMEQVPGFVTKAGYDTKIEHENENIDRHTDFIKETRIDFLAQIRSIGVFLTDEQFEVLLSTVNGDDFIDMALAFETVKGVTAQLQTLTQDSGEDVKTAKKYYGMYTVLLRILDHMQNKFILDIDEDSLPTLDDYELRARVNIQEAEDAIRAGGNSDVLRQNIDSNELTVRALQLYRQYLIGQREEISAKNAELKLQMLAADNTYNTVMLAAQVVSLLKTGIKNFDTLSALEPPELSGFENQELRDEFLRLSGIMEAEQ